MILEEETNARFGYYPRDLKLQSHRRVLATCDDCGEVREISKRGYCPLCRSCVRKGEKGPNFGKHFSKETKAKISQNHADVSGSGHPNWRGGPVERVCGECGKIFYARRSLVKVGEARFCSQSCAGKTTRRDRKFPQHHTKPERIFGEICKKNNLSFRYVGDGQLWIGKKGGKLLNPDFIEANGKKIVVEILGDYWHSPLLKWNMPEHGDLNYRKRHFKRFKWHPIFIWETDLLRPDTETYVLNLLRKEDAI